MRRIASEAPGLKRSALTVLSLTAFIDMLGFSIILPILPFYAEQYGASPATIGLLFASYSFMQFVFSPIWGSVSDRVGRKPILILGLAGAGAGLVVFGLAQSLLVLFVSRIFAGIMASMVPVAQAYVADVTEPDVRAKGLGMIGAAIGLGFVIGPAIGGVLEQFGHGVPAFVAAGLAFANAFWTAAALKESLAPETRSGRWLPIQSIATVIRMPVVVLILAVYFVNVFSFAAMEATFALFVKDVVYTELDTTELARRVGYLLGYAGVIIVVIQGGLLGTLVRVFGESRLISAGLLCIASGLVLLPYSASTGGILAALTLLATGSALIRPSAFSIISRLVPGAVQGGVMSIGQALSGLARAVGPAWGGWMYHTAGFSAPFLYGSGITGLALIGALVLIRLLPAALRRNT